MNKLKTTSTTGGIDSFAEPHAKDDPHIAVEGAAQTVKGEVTTYSGEHGKTQLHDKSLGEGIIGANENDSHIERVNVHLPDKKKGGEE